MAASTELSVLFTSKGDLQNDLSSLRKELQGVQKDIKAATDAGDTGKVDALSRDYASLEGRVEATRHALRKVNGEIKNTATEGVKSTSKLEGAWKKLQKVTSNPLFTAVSVAAITMFAKNAVKAFSEVQDATDALQATFGASGDVLVNWANESAIAFNLSRGEALNASQTFAIFAEAAGLAGTELEGFAISLTERAAEAASYFGGTTQDAIQAFSSALRGEYNPIEKYGVLLNDMTLRLKAVEMGITDTTQNALTPQQKVLVGYAAILEQTSRAQGDVARTQDSMANRIKQGQAQFENLKANVGETIAIGLAPLIGVLAQAMDLFNSMPGPMRTVVVVVGALGAAVLILLPRLLALRQGLIDSGIAASATAGKLGMVGTALSRMLGPIGLAITALTFFWQAQANAEAAGQRLADTLDEVSGAATEATRAMLAEEFLKNFSLEELEQTPFTLNEIVNAALEGGEAFDHLLFRVKDWVENQRSGLDYINPQMNAFRKALYNSVEAAGRDAKASREIAKVRKDAAKVTDEATKKTDDFNYAMTQGRAALRNLAQAFPVAVRGASEYETALRNAKTANDNLIQSFSDLSAAVNAWGSKDNFKASLQSFIEEPTAEAARTMITNMEQAASAIEDPGKRAQFTIDAVGSIKAAFQDAGLKVPKDVRDSLNQTEADALKVKAATDLIKASIDALPDSKTIKFFLQTYGRVPANVSGGDAGPSDGRPDWNGGYVQGPGTATSDSIRKRLSNGEFVMRAAAVRAIGVDKLYRMNSEKAVDPALLERAEVQGHGGPLIGQVVVNNPSENVDVEAAIATALRRAERRRKERG